MRYLADEAAQFLERDEYLRLDFNPETYQPPEDEDELKELDLLDFNYSLRTTFTKELR